MRKDATVLLTGATGYIGGRLLRRLEEDGRTVTIMRAYARAQGLRRLLVPVPVLTPRLSPIRRIGGGRAVLALGVSLVSAPPPDKEAVNPVRTVAAVDLDRYAGLWFEVARYPNQFQRDCTADVTATYSRREDGRVGVLRFTRAKLSPGGRDPKLNCFRVNTSQSLIHGRCIRKTDTEAASWAASVRAISQARIRQMSAKPPAFTRSLVRSVGSGTMSGRCAGSGRTRRSRPELCHEAVVRHREGPTLRPVVEHKAARVGIRRHRC